VPVHFAVVGVTPTPAHRQELVDVDVQATIDRGWHLYSVTPVPPPGPSPTIITVADSGFTVAWGPTEDAPIEKDDPNFGKRIAYHVGSADFHIGVRVNAAKYGVAHLPVRVAYQVCNDKECLPPATYTVMASLSIAPGPARAAFTTSPVREPAVRYAPNGLLAFLSTAFLAGLAALLTPCVFPLIPVTFGFFTKQAGLSRTRLLVLASTYAAGIVVSFTVLGLVSALTFGAAGANKIASNAWVNIFFGCLFVVFALGFFEAIQIRLPQGLARLPAKASGAGGLLGVLLMGLAFVVAAFTCTAPFIGTVLVAAAGARSSGGWALPLCGMLSFGLALALPFLALGLFPSLLVKLPKSGEWLVKTKGALGFIELGLAVTYFSKADYVLQAQLMTRPVIFGLWAVCAVGAVLYLLGRLNVSALPLEPQATGWGARTVAVLFAAFAFFCFYGMDGKPVPAAIASFLPDEAYGVKASSGQASMSDGLDWLSAMPDARRQAMATARPIFVDFTGYTCTNCRWMELHVFRDSRVRSLLSQFTRVRLYTDGGKDAALNEEFQQRAFGSVALPLYAVIAPDGRVLASSAGVTADPAVFALFLNKGLASLPAPSTENNKALQPARRWQNMTAAQWNRRPSAGRPTIVDFSASWCISCHALERTVLTDPQVVQRMPVFDTVQVDLTDFGGSQEAKAEQKYQIQALPAIVFLTPAGVEMPGTRVTGLVPPKEFAARMDKLKNARLG
jgi:thiol:disulfide interchange protein DsbD